MRLVFTTEARSDLTSIGDMIAQDNPRRALSFIDELEARCLALPEMPLAYPLVSRKKDKGIRRLVHGNYLVFYQVKDDSVVILHVLAGSMNVDLILALEE
jgi:toxin ParE1/3/4